MRIFSVLSPACGGGKNRKRSGYFFTVPSSDDGIFFGEILGIKDMVCFHADSINDLEDEFRKSVDSYLEFCKEVGKEPEKPTEAPA